MIRIGTQGWNYDTWVGALYPDGTRPADFLRTYARAFNTVEVDSTFYAIPSSSAVRGWVERTPPAFVFALKLPREITHERRLVDAGDVLDEFCDRVRELGPKLGPVLVQLGPDFGPDEWDALAGFLPLLPADVRFSVEFRQREWIRDNVLTLLADYRVALALTDGRWLPRDTVLDLVARPTTDFHYIRWMGSNRDLQDFSRVQIDRTPELDAWSDALGSMTRRCISIFGYFNNHFAGHSPASARELQRRLGLVTTDPASLAEQTSLFG